VHLFDDRLECFLGPDPVMRMTRVRTDRKRGHSCGDFSLTWARA
jgi:hypothetical protein